MGNGSSVVFKDTKKHYEILDGLRGVAAVTVVLFHLFETFAWENNHIQIINHGYLAVDFFFVLSGYVIGYAYDDRWSKMTLGNFFKRRLIRLHPMVIAGMIIGAITFYFQDSAFFPGLLDVPVWKMILVMLIGFTLIPVIPSLYIRGWPDMHPLNGAAWTLLFEYIGNILYGLFIRKFSNKLLMVFVVLSAIALVHLSVTRGDVIGGWTAEALHLRIGFTRLIYPFFAGLLLSRLVKPGKINNAFLICSILLVAILSIPRLGGTENIWINGLYVAFCIVILFPLIVYLGASGKISGNFSSKLCKFLGDISYPLYITHYPLVFLFMAWVGNNDATFKESLPMSFLILACSILLAYGCFKFYDVPVRKFLTKKFLPKLAK